jgi:hypothetical protein
MGFWRRGGREGRCWTLSERLFYTSLSSSSIFLWGVCRNLFSYLFFSISFDFNRFGWGETKAEVLDMGRVLGVVLIHVHIFESVVDKTHLSPDAAGTHILSPRTSRRKKVKGKIIIMKRPIGKGVPWSR